MATKFGLPGMDLMKGVGVGPLNIGNVLDTMGFVKKAWGAMNAPSAFVPTMDLDELEKRIVDLQAVEQWLNMNLGMIQSTIQALEVQRATISTLKGVTKGMFPGMPQFPSLADVSAAAAAASATPLASGLTAKAGADPEKTPSAAKAKKPSTRGAFDPGLNASAWLEFLQGQFNQVAQAAMSGTALGAKGKQSAASKSANATDTGSRKPAPRKRSASAKKS